MPYLPQLLKLSMKNAINHAIFVRLQYPVAYIRSAIGSFVSDISSGVEDQQVKDSRVVRVSLPVKH